MGFYNNRILPLLIDTSMRNRELQVYRERVLARASGRLLEIGIGSGANLPFYGPAVTHIVGLEPLPRLAEMTRRSASKQDRPVEVLTTAAEHIPLRDHQFDTVVSTWTLCSIAGVTRALAEMAARHEADRAAAVRGARSGPGAKCEQVARPTDAMLEMHRW